MRLSGHAAWSVNAVNCARECLSSWTGLHGKLRDGGGVAVCMASQVKCSGSERQPGDLSSISLHSGLDSMLSLMSVSFCLIF